MGRGSRRNTTLRRSAHAIVTAATVSAILVMSSASPAAAQENDECTEGQSIRVLFLLDTSRSLQINDPDGTRKAGTQDALDDLQRIVQDYHSRVTRYYPQWSVFAAVDSFSGAHEDPNLNNPYGRLSGPWQDLSEPGALQSLRQAADRALREPGYWTDYRAALQGIIERFAEPLPDGGSTCDHLFWFTDGDHDTVAPGVATAEERDQIDNMCRVDGLVAQLSHTGLNVTAIELRVNRSSSEQLRRLVTGSTGDCVGLNGEITDVASVADLAAEIEEIVFRLVDPDFPSQFVDPCKRASTECEYTFVLSTDIEWIKVYIDLQAVENPNGVSAVLYGPEGNYVAPVRFGEEWQRIGTTGILGRQPTANISIVWAHQVSEVEYQTSWGDDQEWVIVFSGPEAEKARAATRRDEHETPRVADLEVVGPDLRGRITPPPLDAGAEVVFFLGDGREINAAVENRAVRTGGHFTLPNVVEMVRRTAQGDAYLASNNCIGTVNVALVKPIIYGAFEGSWSGPLLSSSADVEVPRALCGLSGRKGPLIKMVDMRSSGRRSVLSVVADGGVLDGVVLLDRIEIRETAGRQLPVTLAGVPEVWRCEVPADVRDFSCPDDIDVALVADTATEADVMVTLSSVTTDPLLSPPIRESTTVVVEGLPVEGKLPGPITVGADAKRRRGYLTITTDGGTWDGILTVDALTTIGVINTSELDQVIVVDPDWKCAVPAGTRAHSCPGLQLLIGSGDGQDGVDLRLDLLVGADDVRGSVPPQVSEHVLREITVPGLLPKVTVKTAATQIETPGILAVVVQGGGLDSTLGGTELRVIESDQGLNSSDVFAGIGEWTCVVPAFASGHECSPVQLMTASPAANLSADIHISLEMFALLPSGERLTQRRNYIVEGVRIPSAFPTVIDVAVEEPLTPSGSLVVVARGGAIRGVVSLGGDVGEAVEISGDTVHLPTVEPAADWRCEVPAHTERHECPDLLIDGRADADATVDLLLTLQEAAHDESVGLARTRQSTLEGVRVRVRTAGDIGREAVPYVVVALVVLLAARILSAWIRRRWRGVASGDYYISDSLPMGDDVPIPERGPDRKHCDNLSRPASQAALTQAGVVLYVRWWPLIARGRIEIAARAKKPAELVAGGSMRAGMDREGREAERIGETLARRWLIVKDPRAHRLVVWDVEDPTEAPSATREAWTAFNRGRHSMNRSARASDRLKRRHKRGADVRADEESTGVEREQSEEGDPESTGSGATPKRTRPIPQQSQLTTTRPGLSGNSRKDATRGTQVASRLWSGLDRFRRVVRALGALKFIERVRNRKPREME